MNHSHAHKQLLARLEQCGQYDRCLIEPCLQNNGINNVRIGQELIQNIAEENTNNIISTVCRNNKYERGLDTFRSNKNCIKLLVFNAQGQLESEHLEHIHKNNDDLQET